MTKSFMEQELLSRPMIRAWVAKLEGVTHESFAGRGWWKTHCGLDIGDYGLASEFITFGHRSDVDCISCCAEIVRARLLRDEEIR